LISTPSSSNSTTSPSSNHSFASSNATSYIVSSISCIVNHKSQIRIIDSEANDHVCSSLHWFSSYYKIIYMGSLVIELCSVMEGLKHAWMFGFEAVELHVDSQVVVKMLTGGEIISSSALKLVQLICWLLH